MAKPATGTSETALAKFLKESANFEQTQKTQRNAARGMYITPEKAMVKLYAVLGKRDKAKTAIYDALVSGMLGARGHEMLRDENEGFVNMRVSAALRVIPNDYWLGLSKAAMDQWNWVEGKIQNPKKVKGRHAGYANVTLKTKDINAILTRLTPPALAKAPGNRALNRSWDDWIAAVVILAVEGQLHGKMTRANFLDRVDARLQEWGAKLKPHSTVGPAAKAIIDRFNNNPPVPPLA